MGYEWSRQGCSAVSEPGAQSTRSSAVLNAGGIAFKSKHIESHAPNANPLFGGGWNFPNRMCSGRISRVCVCDSVMVTKIAHHTAEYANVPTLTGFLSQPQSTQPEPNKYIAIPCFSVPGKGLPFPPLPLPLWVPGPLLRLKTRCMRICDTRIVQHRGQSLSLARACLAGNRMRSKATHLPSLCSCS